MDWDAKARAVVAEWKQDVRNGVPVDQWDMLCGLIAQALREADQRGYERGVEAAEREVDGEIKDALAIDWQGKRDLAVTVRSWLMNARERIRALASEREGK